MSDAEVLRRGLLALATLSVVATALELVMLRHWTTAVQAIPFVVLGATAVAIGLVARAASPAALRAARALAAACALAAAYGAFEHVESNHAAGPLDRDFSTTWDAMSGAAQWWEAVSGGVGPSPPVAPGALAFGALLVLLATARHPALRRSAP